MAKITDFYEIQRGEVHLGPYAVGTQRPAYFDWVGNAPAVSLNIEREVQDHYASYDRDRNKDFSVETMTNLTGTLTTDTISPANLAKAFGDGTSNSSTVTQTAITGHTETFTVAKQGVFLQIGLSEQNDAGYRNISNVVITKDDGGSTVTFEQFVDYDVRADSGMIEVLEGGAIEAGDVISVTSDVAASTFTRVITQTASFRGAFKFITLNRTGQDKVYFAPRVVLRPSGDINLITENEFAQLTFNLSFEKVPGKPLMYVDNKPFTG